MRLPVRRRSRPTAADTARRLRTIAAIERGELPPDLVARVRRGGPFTSTLSAAGLLATQDAGARPVALVSGACVIRQLHQPMPSPSRSLQRRSALARGAIRDLAVIAGAWNEARGTALRRLRAEAELAGADLVVGVELRHRRFRSDQAVPDEDAVEVVATGTAVASSHVGLALSGATAAETAALAAEGWRPVDLVAATTVTYVVAGLQNQRARQTAWIGRIGGNTELPDFTQGVYTARERAVARVERAAQAHGADGLVGVGFDQRIEPVHREGVGVSDLIVTLHVVGTAVRRVGDGTRTAVPVVTLG
jgi:uncharacterized protein YbjQ (UPF0145 family)